MSGHFLNDEGVCSVCGYDAVEAWHLDTDRRQRIAERAEIWWRITCLKCSVSWEESGYPPGRCIECPSESLLVERMD
jgi:hypothetical protein